MPVHYLLDTNTVSYVIKGTIPKVRARLAKVPMTQVAISVVTEAELRFGVARRPEAADAILVTNDAAFRQIKRLKTEDWAK